MNAARSADDAIALINATVSRPRRKGADVGVDVFDALRRNGFVIYDPAELDRWSGELVNSRVRLLDLAKVAIRNNVMRCLLVEVRRHKSGDAQIIVCDPLGDEDATVRRIVDLLGVAGVTASASNPGPLPPSLGESEIGGAS